MLLEVFQRKPTAAICVALADLERQLGNPERAREVLQDGLGRAVDVTSSSSSMGSTAASSTAAGERSKMLLSLAWLQEDAFSETGPAFALIDEAFQLDPLNVKVRFAASSLIAPNSLPDLLMEGAHGQGQSAPPDATGRRREAGPAIVYKAMQCQRGGRPALHNVPLPTFLRVPL